MKKHYNEKGHNYTACGKDTKFTGIKIISTSVKEAVDCKVCLKVINKVHVPIKCWIEVRGTDQTWKIDGVDQTVGKLLTYLAGRLTDEVILEEVKKRNLKLRAK